MHGESYSDAYTHAAKLQEKHGYTFVHPFDDPEVIAGQGTIAMEILRQHPGPIHAVFVAVGGGGLISGVGAFIKAVRPDIKVIGVQTTDSDAMARSPETFPRVYTAMVEAGEWYVPMLYGINCLPPKAKDDAVLVSEQWEAEARVLPLFTGRMHAEAAEGMPLGPMIGEYAGVDVFGALRPSLCDRRAGGTG